MAFSAVRCRRRGKKFHRHVCPVRLDNLSPLSLLNLSSTTTPATTMAKKPPDPGIDPNAPPASVPILFSREEIEACFAEAGTRTTDLHCVKCLRQQSLEHRAAYLMCPHKCALCDTKHNKPCPYMSTHYAWYFNRDWFAEHSQLQGAKPWEPEAFEALQQNLVAAQAAMESHNQLGQQHRRPFTQ